MLPSGGIPPHAEGPMSIRTIFPLLLIAAFATSCKQDLPSKLEEPNVFGTVQEVVTRPSEKQLIYQSGQDPYKMNWGSATGYYVKVDETTYPVHWDEAERLKTLKAGDKINLHPSEFIACVGENDLKPACHRLMRIYKSDRQINPLQH